MTLARKREAHVCAELVPASLEYVDDQKMMEAMERIEGIDPARRLEEKVLARILQRRLVTFARQAYIVAGFKIEFRKCSKT